MCRVASLMLLSIGCQTLQQKQPPAHPAFDVANFDPSTPACVDFYQHVNGHWLATHPVPPDQTFWGMSSDAVEGIQLRLRDVLQNTSNENLHTFYATCMDTAAIDRAGLQPIAAELQQIRDISDRRDLQNAFVNLQLLGISAPFAFSAVPDAKRSDRVIAELSQGGLTLPTEIDYANASFREAEGRAIDEIFSLAKIPGSADDVLEIESALASSWMSRTARRANANATYHITSMNDLQQLAPAIDWRRCLAALHVDVPAINVAEPEFMRAVNHLVETEPLPAWRAYLAWHVVEAFAPWLPAPIANEQTKFDAVVTGRKSAESRWQQCVAATDEFLGEALGREYVGRYFDADAKRRVNTMVDNIIAALRDDLLHVDWMSDTTRREALAKLDAVKRKIGYPDKWRDESALKISDRAFATNVATARRFEVQQQLAQIGHAPDPNAWEMTPQTWNAYNNYEKNEIVFPAGILQWPRFDAGLDDAFNYGSIGSVIGHELTHSFDDLGRQWDAHGNVRDWWTPEDARKFNERAACIIDQFDAYEAAPGLHHSGKLVAGESIADLGGLILAWQAWQRTRGPHPDDTPIDGFTPEQRFFIAYAQARAANMTPELERRSIQSDPHPISRLRVNGPLSNMPEFASAFGCRAGDPMVRANRCQIW